MSSMCSGFVPHTVKPTRCRRCFRDISDHKTETKDLKPKEEKKDKDAPTAVSTFPRRRREVESIGRTRSEILRAAGHSVDNAAEQSTAKLTRTRSVRSRSYSSSSDGQAKANRTDSEVTDSTSSDETSLERSEPDGASEKVEENESDVQKSKRIKILATKEVDKQLSGLCDSNIENTSADVEFVLHVKTSVKNKHDGDSESLTATETTETTETTLFHDAVEDLQTTIASQKKQIESLEEKCSRLEKEKKEIIQKRTTTDADKRALEKTASELLKLRTKVHELETNTKDLKEENKNLRIEMKEKNKELNKRETPEQVEMKVNNLKEKLYQTEQYCETLVDENEEIKKEVRKLEEELEELHDNFREDQASEFRDLKRELEAISKNCRVLQFKLRKSEKKCEQLDSEKNEIEHKLKEMQATAVIDADKTKMKALENELKVAKEVYVKMQDELEIVKETNKKLEAENDNLRKQGLKQQGNVSSMSEFLKSKDSITPSNESLLRDLYDAMERENDLREQLNFAEDESKVIRRKLSTLEQENEILMMQLKKMTTTMQGKKKDQDDKEEISFEELKLHLDLSEREMSVLRRKIDELEQENDNLQSEIKYLQDKLINQPMTNIKIPDAPPDKSSPNTYYEHKMKLLEYEAKELRKKLIDKDKENERLQTEVQVYRRKASKVIVRSRSLDSDTQVDLKRQIQLVEQEATILRQKTVDLENDNERLMTENKRLQLRVSRKPPLDSAGELQVENLELKNKISLLEKKLSATQEELEKSLSGSFSPTTIIQEYKPFKESLTESENELITSLKKRLKSEEDENLALKTKLTQLEIDNTKISRDYKKLKDALNYKKKPPKIVRDTVTRMELREIVSELQDEISELQVTLRGRETFHETVEEELEKYRKEKLQLKKELEQKEEELNRRSEKYQDQMKILRRDISNEKDKANKLQSQLEQLASKKGTKVELIANLDTLKSESKDLTKKISKLEDDLKVKESRCKELQDKLDTMNLLKEELNKTNQVLNTKQVELEKEIKKHKQLLSTSEEKLRIQQTTLDGKSKELKTLQKECNSLRAQVDEERVHLKIVDDRQTEVTGTWLKERDNLRHQLNEFLSENKNLKEAQELQETEWENKVKQMEIDHKKKEVARKEAEEKFKSELKSKEDQEKNLKNKMNEMTEKLEKKENMLKDAVDKHRNLNNQLRKEREEWQSELSETESKLRSEVKKKERLEKEIEQIKSQKDEDLLASRDRIVQLEREQRKAQIQAVQLQEQEQQLKQQEKEIEKVKTEYDDLTSRYEQLEEDFVGVKARLVTEKDQIQDKYSTLKRDYDKVSTELKTFKDTYSTRYDLLLKEKLDFQNKCKDLQTKAEKYTQWEQEKQRMKDTIDEKDSLIESYKKEERHLKDERERLRRRIEEASKKVSDLEKSERISRPVSLISRSDDRRQDHKMEIQSLKEEYEGRMSIMDSEIQSMQNQIVSLANERDQLREKLKYAEKNTKEMLTGSLRREKMMEMSKMLSDEEKIKLEDINEELEDALLENKNLKLQYETDKNSWDIQISELQSKINQLEEQKLLESTRGSSRAYAKTRLELAWEKERNEQHRLLAEAQDMMSELRAKVINLERQRDKEKRDSKKRLHEFKDAIAKEHQDIKKKMTKLYGESVDIRTSYDKLRTQYDWLRQDKEKMEKDQEKWREQMIIAQDAQNQIKRLTEDVQKLTSLVKFDTAPETVSSLERRKSYSKLTLNQTNLDDIKQVTDMIKKKFEQINTVSITIPEDETVKKSSFRRAVSVQDVGHKTVRSRDDSQQKISNYPATPPNTGVIRPPPRQKTLNRKSLSLDYTLGMSDTHKIWDSGDESNRSSPSGSQLSLRFGLSKFSAHGYESDTSLPDSEYSVSSISRSVLGYDESLRYQCEIPSRDSSTFGSIESMESSNRPKKTLKEKLKMFKTQSMEVKKASSDAAERVSLSSNKTEKEEKEKSLRSRISKVLKKPLGKSSSVDSEGNTSQKSNLEETASFRGSRRSLVERTNLEQPKRTRSVDAESLPPRPPSRTAFTETPV